MPEPDLPFKFVGRAAGGLNEKALRAKVPRRVSENLSGMLYQLFSSFLRGASCPKSPRAPPLPATFFMSHTGMDVKGDPPPARLWLLTAANEPVGEGGEQS